MISEHVKKRVIEAFSTENGIFPSYPFWIAEMTIINLPIACAVMHIPEKIQAILFTFQYLEGKDSTQMRIEQIVRYSMLKPTTLKDWSDPVLPVLKQINLIAELSGARTFDGDGDSWLNFYYSHWDLVLNLSLGTVPVEDSMVALWLAIHETMEKVASKALLIGLLPELRRIIKRSQVEELPEKRKVYNGATMDLY